MDSSFLNAEAKERFMLRAVELARRGMGFTAPNPCVGAVLVRGGVIVSEGWHKIYGGPHAEVECLTDARLRGIEPAECSLFVTLEPCNHQGKTPPCSKAVLEAGVMHVVVGCLDPNPVAQGGAGVLREAGVHVEVGIAHQECLDLIADFKVWKRTARTYNVLKMAMTVDGKIAAREGLPEPVSGPAAHCRVHELRSRVDAVIVGGGTFYADDPKLTCRLDDAQPAKQPLAVVATTRLPKADDYFFLLSQRPEETIFWTSKERACSPEAEALVGLGCRVWGLPEHAAGGLDLAPGFEMLRSEAGCHYTLCEGGGRLAMSMAEQGLADETWLFVAPRLLGDDEAKNVFSGRTASSMKDALPLRVAAVERAGEDVLMVLRPKESE